jgi:hypothetical protein
MRDETVGAEEERTGSSSSAVREDCTRFKRRFKRRLKRMLKRLKRRKNWKG